MKNKSADGLRGLAAMNVVIAHFFCAFVPGLLHKNYPSLFAENPHPGLLYRVLELPVLNIFYNGHLAVLVFFVLSGYVLTMPYYRNESDVVLKRRLFGRYFRLNLPILAVTALAFVLYRFNLYENVAASELSGSKPWFSSFYPAGIDVSAALGLGLYKAILFGDNLLDPPLWTLKVEFVGSIILLGYYLAKPQRHSWLLLGMLFLGLYAVQGPDSLYFMAIFLGALLNRLQFAPQWNWPVFVLAMYFGGFQFGNVAYNFLPDWQFGSTLVFEKKNFYNTVSALLMVAVLANGFGRAWLESRPVQFLGRISFSIYLLHFLVLCSLSSHLYVAAPASVGYLLFNFTTYVTVCVLLAAVFYRLVDRPAIELSRRFSGWLFR